MTECGRCDSCCSSPPHTAVQYCNTSLSTIEVVVPQGFARFLSAAEVPVVQNVVAPEFEHVDSLTTTADTTTSWPYVNV